MAEAAVAFQPKLRALAFELTGNAADADDLVGETYLRLCERPPKWRGSEQLKRWLRTVMKNTRNQELRAVYALLAEATGKKLVAASGGRTTQQPEFVWNGSEWVANPAKATPAA